MSYGGGALTHCVEGDGLSRLHSKSVFGVTVDLIQRLISLFLFSLNKINIQNLLGAVAVVVVVVVIVVECS